MKPEDRGGVTQALAPYLTSKSGDSSLIKGKQKTAPAEGLFPAYSASGQDIWTENAQFSGPGIVVSAVGARCGKAFLAQGEWTAVANTHVIRIDPGAPIDIKWLWYLMNNERFWIKSGTAQPFVKVKLTLEREQWIPSIDEQRRIVAELEDQLEHLEATRTTLEETESQLVDLRASLLHLAFSPPRVTRVDSLEPGTQRMSWDTKPLGELAQTQLGKMLNSSKQTGKFARRYLRNVNVQWGFFEMSDTKSMDILPEEEEKFLAQRDDLLVCEGGEVGRAAIWEDDEPIAIQNALHRVRVNSELEVTYLRYYLEHLAKSGVLEHYASGVTIKHLPQEKLRRVAISYPPVEDQRRIVAELEDQLEHLGATRTRLEETESQLVDLRASLLHLAFSPPREDL